MCRAVRGGGSTHRHTSVGLPVIMEPGEDRTEPEAQSLVEYTMCTRGVSSITAVQAQQRQQAMSHVPCQGGSEYLAAVLPGACSSGSDEVQLWLCHGGEDAGNLGEEREREGERAIPSDRSCRGRSDYEERGHLEGTCREKAAARVGETNTKDDMVAAIQL